MMENTTESSKTTAWINCSNYGLELPEKFVQDVLDELVRKLADNPTLFCNLNISDCKFKDASQVFRVCPYCSYFQKMAIPMIIKDF
jgi:broad specificity polyphosphatase/5'/3'-nucleotidase SurE